MCLKTETVFLIVKFVFEKKHVLLIPKTFNLLFYSLTFNLPNEKA